MNYFKLLLCALLAVPSASFAMQKTIEPSIEISEEAIIINQAPKQQYKVPALRLLAAHKAVTSDPYVLAQKGLSADERNYLIETKMHQKSLGCQQYSKILTQLADQQKGVAPFIGDIAQTETPQDAYRNNYEYLLDRTIQAGNLTFANILFKDNNMPKHLQVPPLNNPNANNAKALNGRINQILRSKNCHPKMPWLKLLERDLEHHIEPDMLIAAINNNCEIEGIELLTKNIAPAERQDALNNALQAAALKNNEKAVEFLLEQGADCSIVQYSFEKTSSIHSLFTHFTTHRLADRIRTLLLSHDKQQKFVNKKDDSGSGRTPLMITIKQGSIEEIEQLIEHGADIYAKDNQGQTALAYLFSTGFNKQKADLLLSYDDQNRLITELDRYGSSLLFYAIQHTTDAKPNRRDAVAWILQNDTQKKLINYATENGNSALHTAINCFDIDIIKLLINNGANIYACNRDGLTCLQAILMKETRTDDQENSACFRKKRAAIELILAKDHTKTLINNISDQSPFTPLILATGHFCFDPELVNLLIKNGADIYAKEPKTGKTVVHKILECKVSHAPNSEKDRTSKMEALREILQYDQRKILVNEPDAQGNPPLLTAILRSEEFTKLLLESGANLFAQDNQGKNILHHLVTIQEAFYIDVLNTMYRIDKKFVLQKQQDKDGNTPLMIYLHKPIERYHKLEWASYLSHDTDLTVKNKNQETAFDIAHKHQPEFIPGTPNYKDQYSILILDELKRAQQRYHNDHHPYENTIRTLNTLGAPGMIAASVLHYYSSKPKEDKNK